MICLLNKDLKPNNLLIDERGVLKLGDFGLAKFYGSPNRQMTNQVVTMYVSLYFIILVHSHFVFIIIIGGIDHLNFCLVLVIMLPV